MLKRQFVDGVSHQPSTLSGSYYQELFVLLRAQMVGRIGLDFKKSISLTKKRKTANAERLLQSRASLILILFSRVFIINKGKT